MSKGECYGSKRRIHQGTRGEEINLANPKHKHKQQREFIDHQEDIKKELHEMFDDKYGSLDYKFFFYEDERKMLVH